MNGDNFPQPANTTLPWTAVLKVFRFLAVLALLCSAIVGYEMLTRDLLPKPARQTWVPGRNSKVRSDRWKIEARTLIAAVQYLLEPEPDYPRNQLALISTVADSSSTAPGTPASGSARTTRHADVELSAAE